MGTDYATVGRLLANPARSAMVDALMDGRHRAAGELARIAHVSPSSASEHLADLVSGGLARVEADGRHRYYAVASPEVGTALESLSRICPSTPTRSLGGSIDARRLGFARTCYDHLAGWLGVELLRALLERTWLRDSGAGYRLTAKGSNGMIGLGVDMERAKAARRTFARPCLDWTERRPHLAGALGAALAITLMERRWLERVDHSRGLLLTPTGRARFASALGVDAGTSDWQPGA
jgi:DNA-binding transcriptional ArsR family regulator